MNDFLFTFDEYFRQRLRARNFLQKIKILELSPALKGDVTDILQNFIMICVVWNFVCQQKSCTSFQKKIQRADKNTPWLEQT